MHANNFDIHIHVHVHVRTYNGRVQGILYVCLFFSATGTQYKAEEIDAAKLNLVLNGGESGRKDSQKAFENEENLKKEQKVAPNGSNISKEANYSHEQSYQFSSKDGMKRNDSEIACESGCVESIRDEQGANQSAQSHNGTDNPEIAPKRSSPRVRLVLRPLFEGECESGYSSESSPAQSLDRVGPVTTEAGHFETEQPVCEFFTPFAVHRPTSSGFCPASNEINPSRKDDRKTKKDEESQRAGYKNGDKKATESIPDSSAREESRKEKRQELHNEEFKEGTYSEKKKEADRSKNGEKRDAQQNRPRNNSNREPPENANKVAATSDKNTLLTFYSPHYSALYQALEFLPYSTLPAKLEDVIFPDKSQPLSIFDDPYWPNKASCVRLVESLRETASALSTFSGTYVGPDSKGTDEYVNLLVFFFF